MDTSQASSTPRDVLDHPLYRIAHLHGDRWVTLRPDQQHSPKADTPGEFAKTLRIRTDLKEEGDAEFQATGQVVP